MHRRINDLLRCEAGNSAAEYALMLALIGATIVLAVVALGGAISGGMGAMGTCISSGDQNC